MEQTLHAKHALPTAGWHRFVLGAPTAWLVATAACVALGLVLVVRPATQEHGAAEALLPARAPAADVEHAFSGMKPFTVQRNMGASAGKDATCSIYSDGNLDTGAKVTWAVTLCTVHSTGEGPAG